jgi:hypothetical protein
MAFDTLEQIIANHAPPKKNWEYSQQRKCLVLTPEMLMHEQAPDSIK